MDVDKTVTVTFTQSSNLNPTLTIAGGANHGRVTSNPTGLDCSLATGCSTSYGKGTVVTLTATPEAGYSFGSWGGACAGVTTATCPVTMDVDKVVTVTFVKGSNLSPTLTVSGGASFGRVTSSPAGIDCTLANTGCAASYAKDTTVTLTATPEVGYVFSSWGGACAGVATNTCQVKMDVDKVVTVVFIQGQSGTPTLTVLQTMNGTLVSVPPGAIYCGSSGGVCTHDYPLGTSVTLSAIPDKGYSLVAWAGACSMVGILSTDGTGTCTLPMDISKTVTATFALSSQRGPFLSIGNMPGGFKSNDGTSGVVLSDPPGINCDVRSKGGGTFVVNGACVWGFAGVTNVKLTAIPNIDSIFLGWAGDVGDCNGGSTPTSAAMTKMPCTVKLSSDRVTNVFAEFDLPAFMQIVKQGTGTGRVKGTTVDPVTGLAVPGLDCGNICATNLYPNRTLTLRAEPDVNSYFKGWEGECSSAGASDVCQLVLAGGTSYTTTAIFENPTNNPTLTIDTPTNGTVVSNPVGITCGSGGKLCSLNYKNNTQVTLTAKPDTGYVFEAWGGACAGVTTVTCPVVMSVGTTVTVTFTKLPILQIVTAGTGSGTVVSNPVGIDCGLTCTKAFSVGTSILLTVTPSAGSTFTGWSGSACVGAKNWKTCSLTLTGDQTVTATFDAEASVKIEKSGSGIVSSSSKKLYCGSTCKVTSYFPGDVETLVAVPLTGKTFGGWGGDCSGSSPMCTLIVDGPKVVIATFSDGSGGASNMLTVTRLGSGIVSSSSAKIYCGDTCQASYTSGATETLLATPQAGKTFTGWSGDCSGLGKTCTLTLDRPKMVTATLSDASATAATLSVIKFGSGEGIISSSPVGIYCGDLCSSTFAGGVSVDLTAIPDAVSIFAGWSGACLGTDHCRVTAGTTQNAIATFSSTGTVAAVQKAYLAYYGRCGDSAGLKYWSGQFEGTDGDLGPLIAAFGTSAEYVQKFGGLSDDQLIDRLYQNMFGRPAESAGLSFDRERLASLRQVWRDSHGGSSQGASEYALSKIALQILLGTQNGDLDTLNRKLATCPAP
ncbi:hypothetical protein CCP4SC76_6740001 [Gammaproteobacteria bacterium]